MKINNKSLKIILYGVVGICLLILTIILICNIVIVWNASGKTYDSVDSIPHNSFGLVLATSPITPGGAHNFYFDNRIIAAEELYKAGKVDYIIASGGNYTQEQKFGCDEPAAIRDSLVARGIPIDKVILDYEGTRTIHSVYKFAQNTDLDSVTYISQKDHNERAIFLNTWKENTGQVIGYNAKPSHIRRNRIKNTIREWLARVKVFYDIVTFTTPTYEDYSGDASK